VNAPLQRAAAPDHDSYANRRWPNREALLAQAIEAFRNATGYTTDLLDRTPPYDFAKLLIDACGVIARPEIRN
jgi:hypothetical protein